MCVTWCVIMKQNSWFLFLEFFEFLTNDFSQSPHNLKVIFLIDHTTLWQAFIRHCNRRKQWAKPLHLTELEVVSSVLAFLETFIGIFGLWFQWHSHHSWFVASCDLFMQIWIVVECRQHLLSDFPATLFLLKIYQILKQSLQVSCLKHP